MTATLTVGPPATSPGRATFTALAARETRRLVLNPVFLAAAALTAFFLWSGQRSTITAIEDVNAWHRGDGGGQVQVPPGHPVPVVRGSWARLLFVTAAGVPRASAAGLARRMAGRYRLPGALRRAGTLARAGRPAASMTGCQPA
jgi:hypothetical protein